MNNRKVIIAVVLLVAVLALGIGYAALTQTLTINGTATAQESATAFDVYFLSAQADSTQVQATQQDPKVVTSTASVTANNKVAEMAVTLTDVGDSQTCTFTVENDSQSGISAVISPSNIHVYSDAQGTTVYNSEYFDVTVNLSSNLTIPSTQNNNTASFTVTVSLKKAYVASDAQAASSVTENFYIKLDAVSSQS